MDKLKTIIQQLTKEETKEFRMFINRQKQKNNRRDLALFDLLTEKKDYKSAEVLSKLYDSKSKSSAYHALRKRLMRHLRDFLVLKRMDEDNTTASSVMGWLSLARYLLDQKSVELAWHFLKKAEKQALESELFPLLNNIYLVQIENNHPDFGKDLDDLIAHWEFNKKRLQEEENAVVAVSLIRQKLITQRIKGLDQDLETIIPEILSQYNLTDALTSRPKLLHAVLSITRSAYLGRKDFQHFGSYAEKFYRIMRQKKAFTKSNSYYHLDILYMICHAHYRVLSYDNSLSYLKEFLEVIEANKTVGYAKFYPKYVGILSAIWMSSNQVSKAVEITKNILEDNEMAKYLSRRDFYNQSLNLSVYYFAQKEYEKALGVFLEFKHTDKWIEKKMGKGWMFRRNLIELINHIELKNYNYVLSRIRSMERKFKEFLDNPVLARWKAYIKFLEKYIKDPTWFNQTNFETVVVKDLEVVRRRREDIQLMGFYSWLKSKADNEEWYPTFLEVIAQTERIK